MMHATQTASAALFFRTWPERARATADTADTAEKEVSQPRSFVREGKVAR